MLEREGRHFKLSGVSALWQAEEVARSINYRRRVSTTDRLGGGGMASGGSGQLDRDDLRMKRLQALGQATESACSGAGAGAGASAGAAASATPQLFRGASARSSGSMNVDAGSNNAGRKRRRSHSFEGIAAAAGAAASAAGAFASDRSPPAKRAAAPGIAGACYTGVNHWVASAGLCVCADCCRARRSSPQGLWTHPRTWMRVKKQSCGEHLPRA